MPENTNEGKLYSQTLENILQPEPESMSPTLDRINREYAAPAGAASMFENSPFAKDTESFREVVKDVTPEDSYVLEDLGDHKMHYEGQLGVFDFDDREFQVKQALRPEDEYGPNSIQHFMAYIGPETDGSKIHIPEGLRDMTLTFAGTNIESAPKIPASVEMANCAFMDCHNMKEAKIDLPPMLNEAPFMFANCENLQKGPRTIPGTVKNADYMFAACASLQYTPKIGPGVESLNGTFADCKNLTEAPKIPKTTKQARDTTIGCKGIDQQKDIESQVKFERDKAHMEKKLNHKSLTTRLGSMFSAVLQYHALHQQGHGLLSSAIGVHEMRKSGRLGKNVSDGFAAVAANKGSAASMWMASKLLNHSVKHDEKKAERKAEKLEAWTRLHSLGSEWNQTMQKAASSGSKDANNGLFDRLLTMETSQRNIYKASHGLSGIFQAQEDMVRENALVANDESLRKQIAQWYKDRLGDKEAYFKEAEYTIQNNKTYSVAERAHNMDGLEEAKGLMLQPMVESMKKMQEQYGLFNQGDQRDIDRVLKNMGQPSLFHTEENQRQRDQQAEQNNNERHAPQNLRDMEAVPVTKPLGGPVVQPVAPVDLGETHVVTPPAGVSAEKPVVEHVSDETHAKRVRQAEELSGNVVSASAGKEKSGPELE